MSDIEDGLPPEEDVDETTTTPGDFVAELCRQKVNLDIRIADMEEEVASLKKLREVLVRTRIPNGLRAMGTTKTTVMSGNVEYEVQTTYKAFGSLAYAPDIEEAVAYLVEKGMGEGLISKAEVDFTQDELADPDLVARLNEGLAALGKDVNWTRNINPQTLMALVRRKVEKDPSFDAKKVGITLVREAKVTMKE